MRSETSDESRKNEKSCRKRSSTLALARCGHLPGLTAASGLAVDRSDNDAPSEMACCSTARDGSAAELNVRAHAQGETTAKE